MLEMNISKKQIDNYKKDGAIKIPSLFTEWINEIKEGIDFNIDNPSLYGAENTKKGQKGRFFDDYCNWQRIPQFENIIKNSDARNVAAQLMGSMNVQYFHDHVLYKSAGS